MAVGFNQLSMKMVSGLVFEKQIAASVQFIIVISFFPNFKLESLILAQNERWRRA